MTFNEVVAAVIIDTARPDMGPAAAFTVPSLTFPGGGDNRIPNRVAATTLALHSMEFMYKDIKTALISFDATAYIQTLDTRAMPNFRSLSYIRKYDMAYNNFQQNPALIPPSTDSTGYPSTPSDLQMLKVLSNPQEIFDYFGSEKTDIAYQVGDTIMIKSSTPFKQALVGWYGFPNVDWLAGLYDSWICKEYGQALVDATVSAIFATVGKQEQSRKYDDPRTGLVPMWRRLITINNIVAQGS